MIATQKSVAFVATAESFPTGLVGSVGVAIVQASTTITARTTSGIGEYPSGSGLYYADLTAPSSAGTYRIVWSMANAQAPNDYASEDLVVE